MKRGIKVVFDASKRLSNLDKHGLALDDFAEGFDFRSAVQIGAYPSATGRRRVGLIGWLNGELVVAIVSPLGSEAISLISLRPANAKERALHGFR